MSRRSYRELHWGQDGSRPSVRVEVPHHRGLVILGTLAEIGYLTRKGGDKEPVLYEHEFSRRPPPLLAVNEDGELLIVTEKGAARRYTVNERGIVG